MKTDVGTERVLFEVDDAGNSKYCGLITHHTEEKVNGFLPFTNCV